MNRFFMMPFHNPCWNGACLYRFEFIGASNAVALRTCTSQGEQEAVWELDGSGGSNALSDVWQGLID